MLLDVSSTDAACIDVAKQASKMPLAMFINFIVKREKRMNSNKKKGPNGIKSIFGRPIRMCASLGLKNAAELS